MTTVSDIAGLNAAIVADDAVTTPPGTTTKGPMDLCSRQQARTDVPPYRLNQRVEQCSHAAHPVGQGGAVEIDPSRA